VELDIGSQPETRNGDIPWYVTDTARVRNATGWQPQRDLDSIFDEIFDWLRENEVLLAPFFGGKG
jgi:CDP-paratose 2-epimerase